MAIDNTFPVFCAQRVVTVMRNKAYSMKTMAMGLSAAWCLALSACGGHSETMASATTLVKRLNYVACDKPNPVPDEVTLIADNGIEPLRRRCNVAGVVSTANMPLCGETRYFAYSVLDVTPMQIEKTKSIGYAAPDPQLDWNAANNFACN